MKRLTATTLIMEAVVLALAIPVAVKVGHAPGGPAGIIGGVAAVAAIVFAALARTRLRVTLIGGSVLQLVAIISGLAVPVMFFLGTVFAALWVAGIWLGYRVEHAS